MKRTGSKLLMLAIAATLAVILVAPALAKKPLRGTMELEFNPDWSGPSEDVPEWTGSITIDDAVYDMEFYNLGTGKQGNQAPGNTIHFGEIWVILNGDTLLMKGTDEGVVSLANSKYRMNGEVTEAYSDFAIWDGNKVHMSGYITWDDGAPATAPGTLRIN